MNINDKICDVLSALTIASFDQKGEFYYRGVLVSKDDTFSNLNVLSGEKILQAGSG